MRTPPANMRRWAVVGSMLFLRLLRWPNIDPRMTQCLVFVGVIILVPLAAKHPYNSYQSVLLADEIIVIGNEISV